MKALTVSIKLLTGGHQGLQSLPSGLLVIYPIKLLHNELHLVNSSGTGGIIGSDEIVGGATGMVSFTEIGDGAAGTGTGGVTPFRWRV